MSEVIVSSSSASIRECDAAGEKKQKGISEVDNDSVELVKNKARINTQNLTNECHCFSVLAC